LLDRENYWLEWKRARCPTIEYQPAATAENGDDEESDGGDDEVNQARAHKRAQVQQLQRIQDKVKRTRVLWRSGISNWREDLAVAQEEGRPKFSSFIRHMEIAIDPENCIEDEYHPRRDPVYCWRGFRLMARDNLDTMSKVKDGSLENAVKYMVRLRSGHGDDESMSEKAEAEKEDVELIASPEEDRGAEEEEAAPQADASKVSADMEVDEAKQSPGQGKDTTLQDKAASEDGSSSSSSSSSESSEGDD